QDARVVLATDGDLDATAMLSVTDRLGEKIPLLGELDQALEALPGLELRLGGEHARVPQVELARVQRPEVEELRAGLHEDVDQHLASLTLRGAPETLGQGAANLLEARPGQPLVQRDRDLQERLLRDLDGEIDIDRADDPAADGRDEEHLARRDLDQLESLEDRILEARRHGHAQLVRDQAE